MGINFPASPVVGDLYPVPPQAGVPQYKWDGTVWVAVIENDVSFVKRTGDTMTGILALSGDPVADLDAVPKRYAEARALDVMAYSGMQINGGMEVSQENGAATVASPGGATKYVCDGWYIAGNGLSLTGSQGDASLGLIGGSVWSNFLNLSNTTALASVAAGNFAHIGQNIEGYRFARLGWGSAGAKPLTISFWVIASIAGQLAVALRNAAATRAYVVNVAINAPATWEYKTVTIPGETTGTWLKTNGIGAWFTISGACGSTYQAASANTWVTTNSFGTATTSNFFSTINNYLYITGVVVLPGIHAPTAAQSPLIMRPYDQELVTCQRYYYKRQSGGYGDYLAVVQAYTTTDVTGVIYYHPVPMRITPTAIISSGSHVHHTSANASVVVNFTGGSAYGTPLCVTGTFTGASGLVPGNAQTVRWNTASGWFSADARL